VERDAVSRFLLTIPSNHVQPCLIFSPSPPIHRLALPSTCYTPCASPARPLSHCLPVQDGATSLIAASGNGHLEVVQLLLDRGADANAATQVAPQHTHARTHSRDANKYTAEPAGHLGLFRSTWSVNTLSLSLFGTASEIS
jgi:ankyrin repeat protein